MHRGGDFMHPDLSIERIATERISQGLNAQLCRNIQSEGCITAASARVTIRRVLNSKPHTLYNWFPPDRQIDCVPLSFSHSSPMR